MALTHRENYLRNARFQRPEWIPMMLAISGASWNQWRGEMEEVVARHDWMFPGYVKGQRNWDNWDPGPAYRKGEKFKDSWGCVWEASIDGLEGVVVEHPLADWDSLETWEPPDPMTTGDRGPVDWEATRRHVAAAKERGELTGGGVPHGFLLLRLTYLRGFENTMIDMATQDPRLDTLIEILIDHNMKIIQQWVDMDVDMMQLAEDLGAQTSPIIGPAMFRRYITPAYERLIAPCREKDMLVALHSDGNIMPLMDEFNFAGVNIINPQDLCNGIENLAREVKGKFSICLDIDRQTIVPFGTRQEIRDLIEYEVRTLGSPEGGLEMICGIYPPTPPENVDALLEAMRDFRHYWWQ